MFYRFLFSSVFIPHEDCTPLYVEELQGGLPPPAGFGELIPSDGGSGGKRAPGRDSRDSVPLWGSRGEAPEGKIVL